MLIFFEKEFFVGFRASLLFYFVLSAIEWPVPAYNDVEQANIYPLFQHKVHKKSVTSNRNAAFYFQIRCKQSPEQHLGTPMVSILLSIIVCTFKQKSIIKSENSKQIFYDYKQRKKQKLSCIKLYKSLFQFEVNNLLGIVISTSLPKQYNLTF